MENGKKIENTFLAVINTRCPRCRQANMFEHGPYNFGKFLKMHTQCPNCGQNFIPEPGFYFGGMYFSYAINVTVMVIFGVSCYFIFHPVQIWIILASVFIPPILLAPLTFRISRAMMLYIFGGVKPMEDHK